MLMMNLQFKRKVDTEKVSYLNNKLTVCHMLDLLISGLKYKPSLNNGIKIRVIKNQEIPFHCRLLFTLFFLVLKLDCNIQVFLYS